jgi:hypothetical protein
MTTLRKIPAPVVSVPISAINKIRDPVALGLYVWLSSRHEGATEEEIGEHFGMTTREAGRAAVSLARCLCNHEVDYE